MHVIVPCDLSRLSASSVWSASRLISLSGKSSVVWSDLDGFGRKRARANLRYLTVLNLLEQRGDQYVVSSTSSAQMYFRFARSDPERAKTALRSHLLARPDVRTVVQRLLSHRSVLTIREFASGLKELDQNAEKETYYTRGARFLASLFHLVKVVKYVPQKRLFHVTGAAEEKGPDRDSAATRPDPNVLVIKYKGLDLSFVPRAKDMDVIKEVGKLHEQIGR